MMNGYGYGYGGGSGPMANGGGWLFGGLVLCFWFLIIVGIVLLVVWAVRASSGHGHMGMHHGAPGAATPPGSAQIPPAEAQDEAVAIARRRLASGEMTPDQYAEVMKHLGE